MAERALSWGKCTIELKAEKDTNFKKLPSAPVQDSTSVNPNQGEVKKAPLEGGESYSTLRLNGDYSFKADFYVGSDEDLSTWFGGVTEGPLPGDYGVKIVPDLKGAKVIQLDRTILSVSKSYTADKGILLHLEGDVLAPRDGSDMVKIVAQTTTGA